MEITYGLSGCRYQFYEPSDFLKPFVRGYTFTEGFDQFANSLIYGLSTGLPELIFHYEDSELFSFEDYKKRTEQHKGCFVGSYPIKRPHRIFYRKIKMMSILLNHSSLALLFGIPISELPHHAVEFTDITGDKAKKIIDTIANATSNNKRIEIIESYFKQQLHRYNAFNDAISKYLAHVFLTKGKVTVQQLCNDFFITRKTLERLFQKNCNMTPKEFIRIVRFNHACTILMQRKSNVWQDIISECGYYDQSHFINEFKFLLKDTPNNVINNSNKLFYLRRPYLITTQK